MYPGKVPRGKHPDTYPHTPKGHTACWMLRRKLCLRFIPIHLKLCSVSQHHLCSLLFNHQVEARHAIRSGRQKQSSPYKRAIAQVTMQQNPDTMTTRWTHAAEPRDNAKDRRQAGTSPAKYSLATLLLPPYSNNNIDIHPPSNTSKAHRRPTPSKNKQTRNLSPEAPTLATQAASKSPSAVFHVRHCGWPGFRLSFPISSPPAPPPPPPPPSPATTRPVRLRPAAPCCHGAAPP